MSEYPSKKKIIKSLFKAIKNDKVKIKVLDADDGYVSLKWKTETGKGELLFNVEDNAYKFGDKLNYVMYFPQNDTEK